MKPLSQWTEADLKELIGTNEGQSVDFKRSDSIDLTDRKDPKVKELAKDVSAMANAAGGRIYYGIVEDGNGAADRLDDGLDAASFNLDQIGNLLTGNIEPSVPCVTTHAIPLTNGRFAIAIDIPQSMNLAPHQSRLDRLYHRRHDRKTLAMFDHEIKDVMRRATAPEIEIQFDAVNVNGNQHLISLTAKNLSDEPVLYYCVDIMLDVDMKAHEMAKYRTMWNMVMDTPNGDAAVDGFVRAYVTPDATPLFKPRRHELAAILATIEPHKVYWAGVVISAPGFHGSWDVQFYRLAGPLTISVKRTI